MPSSDRRRQGAGGWALLTMLLATALVALSATVAVTAHRIEREREREAELLRAGAEIASAIGRYRDSPFATAPELPRSFGDLIEDRRGPRAIRHLRRVPRDPITDRAEWGLLREGDRIAGVHSLATRPPLRRHGFPPAFAAFESAATLREWRFTAPPPGASPAGASPPGPVRNRVPADDPKSRIQ
jgi:type II secretory pathway pseudopilin PulG